MGKVYGRAYKISERDAKAYRRVDREKSLKANPIGVTAMASINGRGSRARSARALAAGKTRSQRIARAEQVYRNGERPMAGILKNRRRTTTKKKASTKRSSSSKRTKVAGTNFYRTSGGRYQNSKGKFVKASRVKSAKSRKSPAKKTTAKRRTTKKTTTAKRTTRRAAPKRTTARKTTRSVRRNKSVGYSSSYSAGYARMKRSEAAKKAARTRKRRAAAATKKKPATRRKKATTRRTSTTGQYKRIRVRDPKTGKYKLSYLYKTKSGKRRKIPASALKKSGQKTAAQIKRGRAKAAARIKREGSTFVANRSTSARQKRAGRRLGAFRKARAAGKTKEQAKRAALRAVPLRRGDQFMGSAKAPVTTMKKRTKVRRNKKKKATGRKRTVRRNAKRRKTAAPKRRRRTVRRNAAPKRRRRTVRRNARKTTRRAPRRKLRANKRRTGRKTVRRNRRRKSSTQTYRKNAFMANLKNAFRTGALVLSGYLGHRVLTNVVNDQLLAGVMADSPAFQEWKKPLVGLGVLVVGLPVVGMVAKKQAIEIGAGMVASLLQSVIVAGFNAAGMSNVGASLSGYGNSRAYALRGTRRRRRGIGQERHAQSIMPRYQQVRPVGQYSQAAAGQWEQAAAGQWEQAAAGEYFTAGSNGVGEYYSAVGEYFAPKGMQGVGAYEAAGTLALQASAGTSQVIRDGLRPDGDIDRALDVAEAAAGLGSPAAVEHRVPRSSQWIPQGPLWAGERAVTAGQQSSEVSAGILQRQGGNGILSAG